MSKLNRRSFIKVGGYAAAGASLSGYAPFVIGAASKKVVVVGGGMGGAIAAKYIKMADNTIDVTIVEPNANYYTCFMSNEVLSGERSIDSIKFDYETLKSYGIKVVQDKATAIDASAKVVQTAGGEKLAYDRCIVSPGVDFKWETIEGYDAEVAKKSRTHGKLVSKPFCCASN
jgi:sulfide dehydrogenase [flavocytochrome c] flavoprotein chain